MSSNNKKHFPWWAIASIVAALCIGILLYAVVMKQDLGDYSTLVQAIFSIVLAFTTVASIIRSDTQIDKAQEQIDLAQRLEFRHSLTAEFVQDNLVITNLSKYPVLIQSAMFQSSNSLRMIEAIESQVIDAGKQLKPEFYIYDVHSTVNPQLREYETLVGSGHSVAADFVEITDFGLSIRYSYGGSGSITYVRSYKFVVDYNTHYRRASGSAVMLWLQLTEFYYESAMSNGSGRVYVPLEREWDIPLPPTFEDNDIRRAEFMRQFEMKRRVSRGMRWVLFTALGLFVVWVLRST